eukprot:g2159.t1
MSHNITQVKEWFSSINMEYYGDQFVNNGFTSLESITRMSGQDLEDCRVVPSQMEDLVKRIDELRKTLRLTPRSRARAEAQQRAEEKAKDLPPIVLDRQHCHAFLFPDVSTVVEPGTFLSSERFFFDGQGFCLDIYPCGRDSTCSDYISLYLRYLGSTIGVDARFLLKALNRTSREAHVESLQAMFGARDDPDPSKNDFVHAAGCDKFVRRDRLQFLSASKGLRVECELLDLDVRLGAVKEVSKEVQEAEARAKGRRRRSTQEKSEPVVITGLWL